MPRTTIFLQAVGRSLSSPPVAVGRLRLPSTAAPLLCQKPLPSSPLESTGAAVPSTPSCRSPSLFSTKPRRPPLAARHSSCCPSPLHHSANLHLRLSSPPSLLLCSEHRRRLRLLLIATVPFPILLGPSPCTSPRSQSPADHHLRPSAMIDATYLCRVPHCYLPLPIFTVTPAGLRHHQVTVDRRPPIHSAAALCPSLHSHRPLSLWTHVDPLPLSESDWEKDTQDDLSYILRIPDLKWLV